MIFHIAVCSPDPVLRGRVQRHCMEYYARRADACIVEQLESTAALLQQEEAGSRYELYLIELPAANPCSGLQAAAELRRRGVRAPLAFLAHTTVYAYEAFRVDAMQYLHIPFRPEQLTALLDRATEPEYGPVIPVATAMGLRALPFADIEYLECTHHVVHYHLASGEDVASLSLRVPFSEVAKPLLADARFLQPHRSYVVNLAAAAQLSSGELWMRSGARVPIPRGREPAVRAAFRAFLEGEGLSHKKESGLLLRAAFCMVQGHTLSQSSSVQSVRNWSLTSRRAGSSDLLAASAMPMTWKPASWAVRAA